MPDLKEDQTPALPEGLESQERSTMEQEISQIDQMIDDMEKKVNVLRWMVEPLGPLYADPVSRTGSASLAIISVDEEQPGQPLCQRSHIVVLLFICAVVIVAAILSVCVVFLLWEKTLIYFFPHQNLSKMLSKRKYKGIDKLCE